MIPTIPGMPSIHEVAQVERRFGGAAALKFATLGCDPITGAVQPNAAEVRRAYLESLVKESGPAPAGCLPGECRCEAHGLGCPHRHL